MNDQQRDTYVRAVLAAQGYPADEPFIERIAAQFALFDRVATTFVSEELPLDLDLAVVFRP